MLRSGHPAVGGDADGMVANYTADAIAIMTGSLRDSRDVIRKNIAEVWPLATVQGCVVHLVRNTLRYASKAHWSAITV